MIPILYIEKWLFHLSIGKWLFHHFHPFIKEGSQQGSSGQLQKKMAVSDLSKETTKKVVSEKPV